MVEEERKKRCFDSQLVVQKLCLTKDKGLTVQLKHTHRFEMNQSGWCAEYADVATLKESADGASLIFLFNDRALLFDSLTLQLTHNLNKRVTDILGSTILY